MVSYRNAKVVADKLIEDSNSAAGPNPYATGAKPTITLGNLRHIHSVNDVVMETTSAVYKPKPVSVAANVVTYLIAEGTAGADDEVGAVNLSGVTFIARARGS